MKMQNLFVREYKELFRMNFADDAVSIFFNSLTVPKIIDRNGVNKMVEIDTRIFGRIAIEDDKIIRFDHGILGFPDLREFTLIFNEDKGADSSIKWLQSLQEPGFALPVMNPDLVIPGYNPKFEADFLKPLGDNLDSENILMFVTVTVPKDITKTTVNLKAPIIVSIENLKAVQLICDDDEYSVKHAIYDQLMAQKTAQV